MIPEAAASLARARRDLDEARVIAGIGLHGAAARSASYASFHAAEAPIFERTNRIAKTHRGVHGEISRLTKDGDGADRQLWRVLPDGYRYKETADYWADPDATVAASAAAALIDDAARFVDRVAALLSAP